MTTRIADPADHADMAEAQTSEQAADTDRWETTHPLNIRASIPLFSQRYYLTILSGPERRSAERLQEERIKHPLATRANLIFLFSVGFILGGSSWIGLQTIATAIYETLIR